MSRQTDTHRPTRVFRLIQFSDCHVSAKPARYRGCDARAGFEKVLETALDGSPDLLLGTGDMSEDHSEASYGYLGERLQKTGVPFVTVPGNHDEPWLQQRLLGPCPVDEPLVVAAGAWQVIALNSAVHGEIPGALSRHMLDGLVAALDASLKPKAIFLHHQPLPVGSPWIDRYPLREPERLWRVLEGRRQVRLVAWGHIHQPFAAMRGGISLLGAPSTAANSVPAREKFMLDERGPACRWFELQESGGFRTGILGPGWPA